MIGKPISKLMMKKRENRNNWKNKYQMMRLSQTQYRD